MTEAPPRAPAPVRIALLGGECTGKTTLARALADCLPGAVVVEEQLRRFVDERGRAPAREEQAGVMAAQRAAEEAAGEAPWIICDPATIMTAVYSLLYFDDDSLVERALEDCAHYDLMLWPADDVPWRPDGLMRDGAEFRARAGDIIASLVPSMAPVPVFRVRGTPQERLRASLHALAQGAWLQGAVRIPT